MIEVRQKDKFFLALAIPAVAIGAYFYLWRIYTEKRIASLETQSASFVAKEDFESEMRLVEARLEAASKALEEERSRPQPPGEIVADIDSSSAHRESEILNVLRSSGVTVMRSEMAEGSSEESRQALENAGASSKGICRKYLLDGTYPGVKKALDSFAARKMAVIPERVEMREAAVGRWIIYIWQ